MRGRGEGVCHRNSCHPVKPCSPTASGFPRHLLCAVKQTYSHNSSKQTRTSKDVGTTCVKLVATLVLVVSSCVSHVDVCKLGLLLELRVRKY